MAPRRAILIGVCALVVLIGGYAALRATLEWLRTHVVAALGPGAEVGTLDVQVRTLAVTGLRLPGGEGEWPTPHALRAERLEIAPSIRSLFSDRVRIASVAVVQPYVSMVRTRDGRLRVVPTLIERRVPPAPAASAPEGAPSEAGIAHRSVTVDEIRVRGGEVELFDASVRSSPWRIHLVDVDATIGSITGPPLAGRQSLAIQSVVDGPARDGTVSVEGWIDSDTRDLALTVRMRGVDLRAFEPYLAKSTSVRVTGGSFDLDLRPTVKARQLIAPGHLVLTNLSLAGGSASDRILGVPRDLLLKAMAARQGHIAFDFRLEGNVDDPRFSLNETLATRLATSMVDVLGVNLPGFVEGLGDVGGSALRGAGSVGKSVGTALKGVLR